MSNLSAAALHDDHHHDRPDDQHWYDDHEQTPEPAESAPERVEVRRNGVLAGSIGVVAAIVALAYLSRAVGGGTWVDWLVGAGMGLVAAAYLAALIDARTPLLVVDAQGLRIRLGRSWRGVPWDDVECVEHTPRRNVLRDGRLLVVTHDDDRLTADLDGAGRRQVAVARRIHGSPFAFPLSLSTSVTGAGDDLTLALEQLSGDPERVLEVVDEYDLEDETEEQLDEYQVDEPQVDEPQVDGDDLVVDEDEVETVHPVLHDPRPAVARGLDRIAEKLGLRREAVAEPAVGPEPVDPAPADDPAEHTQPILPLVASATPLPLRDPVGGARVEVRFEGAAALKADRVDDEHTTQRGLPEAGQLRRAGADHDQHDDQHHDLEETVVWSDRVRPIARPGEPVDAIVIDEFEVEPAADPVIGPELAAARTRLGLTVDQLADRTRIRPHVIESIEVDDFAPCGGDFYARGHLRTLARVLGIDAAPLLAAYDETYADAPINARRVFEAELATGAEGPIRSMRGGPNWSVLIAAVMALVLAWSIARLIMDSPVELHSQPVLNGSPSSAVKTGPPVPVLLDAARGGAHVVVRDGNGDIVFSGNLSYGETKSLKAAAPVRVQSSDGSLQVTVDGAKRGPLGADGQPAQNTFAAKK